jgi:hypothetical protein
VPYQSQPLEVSAARGPVESMVALHRSGHAAVYLAFVAR